VGSISPIPPRGRHRLASAGLVTLRNELSRDFLATFSLSSPLSFYIFSPSWFYLRSYSRSGRNTRAITCRYWSLIGAPGPSVDMPIIGLPRRQPTPARLVSTRCYACAYRMGESTPLFQRRGGSLR